MRLRVLGFERVHLNHRDFSLEEATNDKAIILALESMLIAGGRLGGGCQWNRTCPIGHRTSSPGTQHLLMSPPLSLYAKKLAVNFDWIAEVEPNILIFAENVHQCYQASLDTPFPDGESRQWAELRWRLLQMSHIDWVHGYILTAGGQRSIGVMVHRRAIEFVAYSAKITDQKRANIYLEKSLDPEKMRNFTGSFRIPYSFHSEKYSFLRPLLGAWDLASDWGVHANWETTAFRSISDGMIGHQDDPGKVLAALTIDARIGYWLLRATEKLLSKVRPTTGDVAARLAALQELYKQFKAVILEKEPYRTQLAHWGGPEAEDFATQRFHNAMERKPKNAFDSVISSLKNGELAPERVYQLKNALEAETAENDKPQGGKFM